MMRIIHGLNGRSRRRESSHAGDSPKSHESSEESSSDHEKDESSQAHGSDREERDPDQSSQAHESDERSKGRGSEESSASDESEDYSGEMEQFFCPYPLESIEVPSEELMRNLDASICHSVAKIAYKNRSTVTQRLLEYVESGIDLSRRGSTNITAVKNAIQTIVTNIQDTYGTEKARESGATPSFWGPEDEITHTGSEKDLIARFCLWIGDLLPKIYELEFPGGTENPSDDRLSSGMYWFATQFLKKISQARKDELQKIEQEDPHQRLSNLVAKECNMQQNAINDFMHISENCETLATIMHTVEETRIETYTTYPRFFFKLCIMFDTIAHQIADELEITIKRNERAMREIPMYDNVPDQIAAARKMYDPKITEECVIESRKTNIEVVNTIIDGYYKQNKDKETTGPIKNLVHNIHLRNDIRREIKEIEREIAG